METALQPFPPSPFGDQTWVREDGYQLSTDRERLDLSRVHAFLANESYWARDLPMPLLRRAIENSLALGLYAPDGSLAGFARVVTDYALFAYLRDVFVLGEHQGRGLAGWLARCAQEYPPMNSVSNWMLATADAHGVYAKVGFMPASDPTIYMTLRRERWLPIVGPAAAEVAP